MASNNQSSVGTFDFFEQLEKMKVGGERETSSEEEFLTAGESSPEEDTQFFFSEDMARPPPIAKKLRNPDIKEILAPALVPRLGIMFPIEAVLRDAKDPEYKPGALKEDVRFTTQKLTFRNFRKDGGSFVEYKNALAAEYEDDQKIEFLTALTVSNQYIGSMGTIQGLLNRLVTGLTKVPSVHPFDVDEEVLFVNSVLTYYTVDVDYVGKSLHDVMRDPRARAKFNGKSSLGVPYGNRKYKKTNGEIDGEVISLVYEYASLILKSIATGSFSKLYVKRPALFLVLLKNKQDFYRLDELEVKTRPYFVYPAHERLLYQAIQTPLKAVLFNEGSSRWTNSSAVGFVWNYGGGDQLYDWILNHDEAHLPAEFRSIFYGDDQLWVIRLKTGAKYVVVPDFSHMDLSLVKQWFRVAYGVWKPLYTKIDKTWSDVLLLNCRRCFSKTTLVESSLAYSIEKGVGSGIPGTTKFDEVASAAVNGFIKYQFSLVAEDITVANLPAFLDTMKRRVAEKYGLTFKEGTLALYPFTPDQPEYDFEFLGQTLFRVVGGDGVSRHYVPKPKLHRLLLTATSTRKAYTSPNLMERSFQTIRRSLVANGGYLFPMFYEATKALYERRLEKGFRPLSEDDEEFEYEVEEEKFFNPLPYDSDDFSFPTVMRCMNLFLPDHNQIRSDNRTMNEHIGKTVVVPMKKPRINLSLDSDDEYDGADSEFGTPSRGARTPEKGKQRGESVIYKAMVTAADNVNKDWGKSSEVERDMFDDVGGVSVPAPKIVSVATQDKLQPLPEAQKEAFTNKMKEQAALRKAMRENSFDQSKATKSRKIKKGSSSKYAQVIDFDDPDNFDPDVSDDEAYYDAA